MKLRIIFTILIASVLIACSPIPRPTPFLNERRMVELLTEIHVIEAQLQQMQNQGTNFDAMRIYTTSAYAELFERFGLTQESFEANMFFRTYQSRDIERIQTRVQENLQRMFDERQEIEMIPQERVLEADL